jgi:hypothetical protein
LIGTYWVNILFLGRKSIKKNLKQGFSQMLLGSRPEAERNFAGESFSFDSFLCSQRKEWLPRPYQDALRTPGISPL